MKDEKEEKKELERIGKERKEGRGGGRGMEEKTKFPFSNASSHYFGASSINKNNERKNEKKRNDTNGVSPSHP